MKHYYSRKFTRLSLAVILCLPLSAAAAGGSEREILYWGAPMDPAYRSDKPGKSPMGMDLIPIYAGADGDDGSTVSISPQIQQSMGVRTRVAERSRLWRGIDTVGYVGYDESKVSHIHLRTRGWIENLAVQSEGERVIRGERLFDIYSPELVNAQEEFVQALTGGNKRLAQASRDRLKALGVAGGQITQLEKDRRVHQTIPVFAPQNGVVSTLSIREGMFVKPETRVMSLADLSSIWILAEVFERQVDWVAVGQSAEVTLAYLPGRIWKGQVEYIYPSLDPKTRTLKVRLRFANPDEALKPNMFAKIKIFGGAKNDVVVIPMEALIRTGREERVILALGEGKFAARRVTAGIESGDWVEILDGIDAGDTVVVSGQFLIDSEASLKASIMRLSEPASSVADTPPTADGLATGSGTVTARDPAARTIRLDHGAISVLDWPAMEMQFQVEPGAGLHGIVVGDSVEFDLSKRGEDFVITAIRQVGQ